LIPQTSDGQQPTVTSRIPFFKMSGSGNDFLVIDNREGIIPPEAAVHFARAVCRRRVSVGADGVVLIERARPADGADFRWRYVNADGSDGEMCGNGAMCGARFAVLQGIAPPRCVFQTASGLVRAEVDPDPTIADVRIAIADPGPIRPGIEISAFGHSLNLHAISVGVPHAILIVDDVDTFVLTTEFVPLGRAIRYHHEFAPAGTNFDAIERLDGHALRVRTYERGVEDETLACGTGAVASAIVATTLGLVTPPVTVITSSGLPLTVAFTWNGTHVTSVTLTGEARVISTGELGPEALR
jgi:diaminopimelate epimerase